MAHSAINVFFAGNNFSRILQGLWTSIWIAGASLIIGLILGTL